MAYADLTTDQKSDIAKYDTFIRGLLSIVSQLARDCDPATWAAFAQMSVDPVIAGLADDDVIPNSTGLGGAKDLTVAEFKALQTLVRGVLVDLNTNRATVVKAVGVNA